MTTRLVRGFAMATLAAALPGTAAMANGKTTDSTPGNSVVPRTSNATNTALLSMMTLTSWSGGPSANAVDGYTRLELLPASLDEMAQRPTDNAPPGSDIRRYDEQKRPTIWRYFAGKSIARLLTVKATIAHPQVSNTVNVVSVGYDSSKKAGESWTTEQSGKRLLTPYFRIDPESGVNVEAVITATSTYDMSAATAVLDVVKRGAALIQPSSVLVTSLNKDRFQDASQFVDQSISSLLRESIVERASNDFAMKDSSGLLATIDVWLPTGDEITPGLRTREAQQSKRVGRWEVRAAPAIVSIFSDVIRGATGPGDTGCETSTDICLALRNLSPHVVMNFLVDSGVTIFQALSADTGIAGARDKLISSKNKDDARVLCLLVADKAQAMGFNRVDVSGIVWAYANQGFVNEDIAKAMRNRASCPALITAFDAGLPGEATS